MTDEKLNLENLVIGGLVSYSNTKDIALQYRLSENDFDETKNKAIFRVFKKSVDQYKAFDLMLLRKAAKEQGENVIFTFEYVQKLIDNAGASSAFEDHIRALKDEAMKSMAYRLCRDIQTRIALGSGKGSEIVADLLNSTSSIIEGNSMAKYMTFADYYDEALKEIAANKARGTGLIGLPTGFSAFDEKVGGLADNDLTILAAGPGEGKSTFALNVAHNISKRGIPVLFFSLEMGGIQLAYKIFSSVTEVSVKDIRMGEKFDPSDKKLVAEYRLPLHIIPKAGINVDEVVAITKARVKRDGIKLVIVDYLQLVEPSESFGGKRHLQVGSLTRKFKKLALELSIPIVALSQLNRDKTRKSYELHDLRDSGELEQDADNVVFIYRPFAHDQYEYAVANEQMRVCDMHDAVIKIAKCRLGDIGAFWLKFYGEFSKFVDDQPNPFTPF